MLPDLSVGKSGSLHEGTLHDSRPILAAGVFGTKIHLSRERGMRKKRPLCLPLDQKGNQQGDGA